MTYFYTPNTSKPNWEMELLEVVNTNTIRYLVRPNYRVIEFLEGEGIPCGLLQAEESPVITAVTYVLDDRYYNHPDVPKVVIGDSNADLHSVGAMAILGDLVELRDQEVQERVHMLVSHAPHTDELPNLPLQEKVRILATWLNTGCLVGAW